MTDLSALAGATILFDLDGTLIDTAPDLVATLNLLLEEEGLPALAAHDVRPMIGRGARWLIQQGFEAAGEPLSQAKLAELFDRFIAHYRAHIADGSAPFPGCVEALDTMRAAGASLVIATNKRTDLSVQLIETLGLKDRFDAIVGPDLTRTQKPDPAHLLEALRLAEGHRMRSVMVGDAVTDADAARGAGIPLVLVSFGYTETPAAQLRPNILIDHFDALPAACQRLLSGRPAGLPGPG